MTNDPDTHYRLISPLVFERCDRRALFSEGGRRVWIQQDAASRSYLRRGPVYHDDPDGSHLFPDLSTLRVSYPPAAVVVANDVALVGFRSYLSPDGCWFTDELLSTDEEVERYLARISSQDAYRNEKTGLVPGELPLVALRPQGASPTMVLEGPVIAINSDEPENYGSFLFRVLPKLLPSLVASEAKVLTPVPNDQTRALLNAVGISNERIIPHDASQVYHLKHAIVPTVRNPHAFLDEVSLGLFAKIRPAVTRATASRIFISRASLPSTKRGYRQLINGQEVIDALRALDFVVIEPEALTVDQQMEYFANASIVVGQSGAGLFNAVFCQPGTFLVDIESEPHWIHAHMCLFSSLNLRYCIFEASPRPTAERRDHVPFLVNVPALVNRLKTIITNT